MKKPRRPKGMLKYANEHYHPNPPVKPPTHLESYTEVRIERLSEGENIGPRLTALIESFPLGSFEYVLDIDHQSPVPPHERSWHDIDHCTISATISVRTSKPTLNPNFEDRQKQYEKKLAEHRNSKKIWDAWQRELKLYNEEKQRERELKQLERLQKKYGDK